MRQLFPLLFALLISGPVLGQVMPYQAGPGPVPPNYQQTLAFPDSAFDAALYMPKSLAAGTNAVFCLEGDSTATISGANSISPIDQIYNQLVQKITSDYAAGGITLTSANFLNLSVSGSALGTAIGGNVGGTNPWGGTYPSWWTNHNNTWQSYATTCTTIFFAFGLNDYNSGYETPKNWGDIWTQLVAFTNIPDIVVVTNYPANPQATGDVHASYSAQSSYQSNASVARTVARSGYNFGLSGLPPIGILDLNLLYDEKVLGYNPLNQALRMLVVGGNYQGTASAFPTVTAFPYTLPSANFAINGGSPANPGGDFTVDFSTTGMRTNDQVQIQFGDPQGANAGNNYILFWTNNGTTCYFQYTNQDGVGGGFHTYSANVWNNGGTNGMILTVKQERMQGTCNGTLVFDVQLPRYINSNTPVIQLIGAGASIVLTMNNYGVGVPETFNPTLTGATAYGNTSGNGPYGGGGTVHASSAGLNDIQWEMVRRTNFYKKPAPFKATSGSISGALIAPACNTGTVAVNGAAAGMRVTVAPNTYPGAGFHWDTSYVSAANTVTVQECASASGTPAATTFNVSVQP